MHLRSNLKKTGSHSNVKNDMKVWLTRTSCFAGGTLKLLQDSRWDVVSAPLMDVVHLDYILPFSNQYTHLIISSLHAAKELIRCGALRNVPIISVGNKTQDLLVRHGFCVERVFDCVDHMVAYICSMSSRSCFLHIRGVDVAKEIEVLIKPHIYVGVNVYKTIVGDLSVYRGFKDGDVVVFHSVKAAKIFARYVDAHNCYAVVLSDNIASICAAEKKFKKIFIALYPSDDGILQALDAMQNDGQ